MNNAIWNCRHNVTPCSKGTDSYDVGPYLTQRHIKFQLIVSVSVSYDSALLVLSGYAFLMPGKLM